MFQPGWASSLFTNIIIIISIIIITIPQHHHQHHQHHHHYSPASPNMTWGVNWALVEYSSDDRNMYDIEIHGWSRFEFFLTLPFIRKCQDFGRYVLPTKFLFGKVTLWKRSLAKTCLDALPISLLDWHGSH